MKRTDAPDDISKAERKLSGACVECDDKGYFEVWFTGQASDMPYTQPCQKCTTGEEWRRENVIGLRKNTAS